MRTYEEICEDLRTAIPGEEARKLHKELKAYGEGLRFLDRYPYAICIPAIIAIIVTVLSIVLVIALLI